MQRMWSGQSCPALISRFSIGIRPGVRTDWRTAGTTDGSPKVEDFLVHWLEIGGLFALAGVMASERFVPVLPSYAVLALGGIAAAGGAYDVKLAIAATTLGSFLGSLGWYGVGYAVGPDRVGSFVARRGRWFGLTPSVYERSAAAYRRHSRLLLMLSQLIPTVRIFATFPAGVLRVPAASILLPTFLGILGWNGAFVLAGYLLEESPVGENGLALPVLLAVVLVEALLVWGGYLLWKRWRKSVPRS